MAKRKSKIDPVLGEHGKHSVYVRYSVTATGGEICSGQENDGWPSRDPEHRSHEVVGIFTDEENDGRRYKHYSYNEQTDVTFAPKSGNTVHLVLVIYQTGDTFGYSTGNVSVVGVYETSKEAKEIAKSIRAGTYSGYKCWDGYFERLESIEVSKHVIGEAQGVIRF